MPCPGRGAGPSPQSGDGLAPRSGCRGPRIRGARSPATGPIGVSCPRAFLDNSAGRDRVTLGREDETKNREVSVRAVTGPRLSELTFRRRGPGLVQESNVDPSDKVKRRRREVVEVVARRREASRQPRGSEVTRASGSHERPNGSLGIRRAGRRGRVGVVKPRRARGGCLGVAGNVGVAGCDKLGGGAERPSIPRSPQQPRELKHLSTWRNGKQPRLPQ